MPFPIEFTECPVCHCKDTVCRLVSADEPSIPKGAFVSFEKVFTAIQDLNKITTPTIRGVLNHYDICAKCGTRYCTKSEIITMPVQVQYRSGEKIRGIGPAR